MYLKKILPIISLAILTINASAQSLLPTKYGIQFGINSSNLNISQEKGLIPANSSTQIGVNMGACMHIPLSDKWYLNPELLFTQRGASFNYNFSNDYPINQRDEYEVNNKITLSYATLNPTVSFKPSNKLALNIGPSISFLIGTKDDIDIVSQSITTDSSLITKNLLETETLDVGLNVGVSYFITEKILFDTKIYRGIINSTKILQPYTDNTDAYYTAKNKSVIFSFAYLF